MDWKLFFQLVVTAIVAIVGAWFGHQLSARRDLWNERRKLRVSYLLEAYRRLEDAGNRNDAASFWPKIESAVADIQLLGSPEQVQLARDFASAMARDSAAPLDDLLFDLRSSLRAELNLPAVALPIAFLRFRGTQAPQYNETLRATVRDIVEAKEQMASHSSTVGDHENAQEPGSARGNERIEAEWNDLESIIRSKLSQANIPHSSLSAEQAIDLAFKTGQINAPEHRSLIGLNVMKKLAAHRSDGEQIDDRRTGEFTLLADAMRSVLKIKQQ